MAEVEQLAALARIVALFEPRGIEYWLFGGWAVDFHLRAVTRAHDDLDVAVWRSDLPAIAILLEQDGWEHAPDPEEDGYTVYRRGGVRMDLAFLARGAGGVVHTPLRDGSAPWPPGAFGADVAELLGTRARIIALAALEADKSEPRDSPLVAAKDRADLAALARLR
jgi:Aminoglycoside-2''-adenylyltransferase